MGISLFGKRRKSDSEALSAELEMPRKTLGARLKGLFTTDSGLDEDAFEEMEEILISADVGVETTLKLMQSLREDNHRDAFADKDGLRDALMAILDRHINEYKLELTHERLNVLMMMGVNGVGKTTTIGKLSKLFKDEGVPVMVAACDTFRAAAVQQLQTWADRVDVPIVKDDKEGADPGSVLYRAVDEAFKTKTSLLIVDTAGRMHTRANLMQEMEKLSRILQRKAGEGALSAQNLMVLDANTGQNALEQATEFHAAANIDGVVLTKLDSTAKGGIVLAIAMKLGLPIAFVGTGEKAENLRVFETRGFIEAILG